MEEQKTLEEKAGQLCLFTKENLGVTRESIRDEVEKYVDLEIEYGALSLRTLVTFVGAIAGGVACVAAVPEVSPYLGDLIENKSYLGSILYSVGIIVPYIAGAVFGGAAIGNAIGLIPEKIALKYLNKSKEEMIDEKINELMNDKTTLTRDEVYKALWTRC